MFWVVADALDAHLTWAKARGLRPATIAQRRRAIRRFTSRTGVDPLQADRRQMADWYESLTTSLGTRAVELSHIRAYCQWGTRHELIAADPTILIDAPRLPRRMPRPIRETDLAVALRQADPRMRAVLTLAAFCGLRAGEIAQLEWAHLLDVEDGPAVLVADGKGGRQRIVPLHPVTSVALGALPLPHRGPVIRRLDGQSKPIRAARLSCEAADYLRSVDVDCTLHQLRHRYATQTHRVSRDLRLVQELLGHASSQTTQGYVAWDQQRAQHVISQVPDPRHRDPGGVG